MPQAAPFFIWLGGVAASALGGGAIGVAVGNFIINYGLAVVIASATTIYSHQQSIKVKNSLKAKGATLSTRDAAASRKIIYGRQRVGGTTVFIHTTGTDNKFAHLIICHAGHEVDSFESVQLGEDSYTPDGSGNVTAYDGHAYIKTHRGYTAEAAESELVADSGGYWTSSDKVAGCAYTYSRFQWNADKFPQGMPAISVVLKGKKLYDPRDASTAWSDNPALCIRDYLTDSEYGLGCTSDEIDDDSFIAAANICDEDVDLADLSTEKRYTCNGIVDTATSPKAIIEDLLTSCAGTLIYTGGVWRLLAGADRATAATFTTDNLVSGVNIQTADSIRATCNAVKGIYVSEKTQWQVSDFPPVTNSTYRTEDNGERIWRDIELPYTTSSATAQRLAKIVLEQTRQQITVSFSTNLSGLAVAAGDIVALPFERYGWDSGAGKLFEVVTWKLASDQTEDGPVPKIDMVLREYAAGAWDWDSGEETEIDLAPNTNLLNMRSVSTPAAPTLSTSNFQQADGTITPRLRVQWTAPADARITSGGFVQIEYKKSADGTWLVWTSTLRGSAAEDFITDVLAGVSYDVRQRFVNSSGVAGAYSATATATVSADTTAPATPGTPTATSAPGAVSVDWPDNTETDFAFYRLYRHTSDVPASATIVWNGRASTFTDFKAAPGTTYFYWVVAVDTTNNASAKSLECHDSPNPATGNFFDNIFKRAATIPATPTGSGLPAGWYGEPPAPDGNPLWWSIAEKTSTGSLVGAWSTPVRLDGEDGATGAPGADGTDGVNGDDGIFREFVWRRAATIPATPTGNGVPASWYDDPPAADGNPLWMSVAKQELDGALIDAWSTPIRHDGPAGADGDSIVVEYSIDGSTSWHSTYTAGDFYMRQAIGAGSWSDAIKISGEIIDGEITTAKLANGAVSNITSVQESTASGITNNAWTEVAAIAVSADEGQDVVIIFSFFLADDGAVNCDAMLFRVLRDGTEIYSGDWSVTTGNTVPISGSCTDPDLAGSVAEYSLELKPYAPVNASATPSARTPVLTAIILKDREN